MVSWFCKIWKVRSFNRDLWRSVSFSTLTPIHYSTPGFRGPLHSYCEFWGSTLGSCFWNSCHLGLVIQVYFRLCYHFHGKFLWADHCMFRGGFQENLYCLLCWPVQSRESGKSYHVVNRSHSLHIRARTLTLTGEAEQPREARARWGQLFQPLEMQNCEQKMIFTDNQNRNSIPLGNNTQKCVCTCVYAYVYVYAYHIWL